MFFFLDSTHRTGGLVGFNQPNWRLSKWFSNEDWWWHRWSNEIWRDSGIWYSKFGFNQVWHFDIHVEPHLMICVDRLKIWQGIHQFNLMKYFLYSTRPFLWMFSFKQDVFFNLTCLTYSKFRWFNRLFTCLFVFTMGCTTYPSIPQFVALFFILRKWMTVMISHQLCGVCRLTNPYIPQNNGLWGTNKPPSTARNRKPRSSFFLPAWVQKQQSRHGVSRPEGRNLVSDGRKWVVPQKFLKL